MFETKDETESTSPLQIIFYTYYTLGRLLEKEKRYNEEKKYSNRESVEDAATGEN